MHASQGANPLSGHNEAEAELTIRPQQVSALIDKTSLGQYIAEFGLKLSELEPWRIAIFTAAKNLERFVKDLKIPMAVERKGVGKTILVEREVEKTIERTSYRDGRSKSSMPADDMDVAALERPEELPDILPPEWLTEEEAEDLFYKRLTQRELLKRQWLEHYLEAHTTYETVKERKTFEEPAPPETEKQHAAALLDCSGSMSSSDQRFIVAKGLVLAFLRAGREQRAHLNFRGFTSYPFHAETAETESEFYALVRSVLHLGPEGSTDIEWAIRETASDIRSDRETKRADILLITDGLSRLGENPLGKVKLHTFIVGTDFSNKDAETLKQLKKLKRWSTNFTVLDSEEFKDILVPTREDLEELTRLQERVSKSIPLQTNKDGVRELGEQLERLADMGRWMLRHSFRRKNPPSDLVEFVNQAGRISDAALVDPAKTARENRTRIRREEAEAARRQKQLEKENLAAAGAELSAARRAGLHGEVASDDLKRLAQIIREELGGIKPDAMSQSLQRISGLAESIEEGIADLPQESDFGGQESAVGKQVQSISENDLKALQEALRPGSKEEQKEEQDKPSPKPEFKTLRRLRERLNLDTKKGTPPAVEPPRHFRESFWDFLSRKLKGASAALKGGVKSILSRRQDVNTR